MWSWGFQGQVNHTEEFHSNLWSVTDLLYSSDFWGTVPGYLIKTSYSDYLTVQMFHLVS